MGSLDGTDGFEYEEGPRPPSIYQAGFCAGYDGDDWPGDANSSRYAQGWQDGRDAWDQEKAQRAAHHGLTGE